VILIPLRTSSGLNMREHWTAKARRVKRERTIVGLALMGKKKPAIPCSVLLTRVAPSNGLDDDNLVSGLKAVRDEVAAWIGVDDKLSSLVRYRYAQKRGPWGVEITFGPPVRTGDVAVEIAA